MMTASQRRFERRFDFVRWLAVLPLAYVAWWLSSGLFAMILSFTGIVLRRPDNPSFLFPLLYYFGSGISFTLVGGLVAPSWRLGTAIVLALVLIALSIQIHIMGQPNPGTTNYMHSTGEALGAVVGVAVILCLAVRRRLQSPERKNTAGTTEERPG